MGNLLDSWETIGIWLRLSSVCFCEKILDFDDCYFFTESSESFFSVSESWHLENGDPSGALGVWKWPKSGRELFFWIKMIWDHKTVEGRLSAVSTGAGMLENTTWFAEFYFHNINWVILVQSRIHPGKLTWLAGNGSFEDDFPIEKWWYSSQLELVYQRVAGIFSGYEVISMIQKAYKKAKWPQKPQVKLSLEEFGWCVFLVDSGNGW